MNKYEWKSVLDKWNKDILDSRYQEYLPEEAHDKGWLGFSGATQGEITAAELRLQTRLPESYREFLSASNGWRMTTPFIDRVWGTEEIEWLAVKRMKVVEDGRRYSSCPGEPDFADGELYTYGEAQDLFIRQEHFENSLEVGFGDQLDLYLLLPDVTPLEGEWAACLWSPKSVESIVYRSFWELMLAEYESFLRLKDIE
jgi:hypothetical protein